MSEFYGDSDSYVSDETTHILKEGMILPNVTFKTRVRVESSDENPFEWKDMTTDDYFKGKKCILFSKTFN